MSYLLSIDALKVYLVFMYIKNIWDGLERSNNSRFFVMLAMVHKNFFMAFTSFFPPQKIGRRGFISREKCLASYPLGMSLLLTSLSGCSIFRWIPFLYTPLGFIFLITKYKLWCWIDLALGLHIYGFSSPQHQEFLCMSETCVSNIHQEKCFQEIS